MLALGDLFISLIQTNPTYFFAVVITVVVSITLHELAHGWVAMQLGDDTPELTGHMTLNPIVHMGVFSLILLMIAGIAFGAMPVNRTRLRGKYAEAWVALAGPAMNLLLALLALTTLALWQRFDSTPFTEWSDVVKNGKFLLMIFGVTNIILMFFNLLPLPPLDGSYVAANFIPAYRRFLSGDMVRGIMTAVFFAMFMGGTDFIDRYAMMGAFKWLTLVSGQSVIPFYVILTRGVT